MTATALSTMLLLGAAGCGPRGPGMVETAACDRPMITVDNPTPYEIDVLVYSATTRREELVGTVDADSRVTFTLPPGSAGGLRAVPRNVNQQETYDDRRVRISTHCA